MFGMFTAMTRVELEMRLTVSPAPSGTATMIFQTLLAMGIWPDDAVTALPKPCGPQMTRTSLLAAMARE